MSENTYNLKVYDRNYTKFEIIPMQHFNTVNLMIDPIKHKLFNGDVFTVDENQIPILQLSQIRNEPNIPGVLIINGNKTYGKLNSKNNTKLLYKFIPNDNSLPSFLVPYEIKHVGFSKVFQNIYATVYFKEWCDKHPCALINNVLGDINILSNYYEYKLYCKSLNISMQQFQKITTKKIGQYNNNDIIDKIFSQYSNIQNRTDTSLWKIITIDPINCQDKDDGFSVRNITDTQQLLSIYISNVPLVIDVLELWNHFTERVSTIYLPDKNRPLLPAILSDNICSLHKNEKKATFVMDVLIENYKIIKVDFCSAIISVWNNYAYDDLELLSDITYQHTFSIVKQLSNNYKYIEKINDSHDLVCYLMILMNYYTAMFFAKNNTGILRNSIIDTNKQVQVPDYLPNNVSSFIKLWNSSTSNYVLATNIDKIHSQLQLDAYTHITSPIRRLVDILNMIQFQLTNNLMFLSNSSREFYNKWEAKLDYINKGMKSIKKVQNECVLLNLCNQCPDILQEIYQGYLFDKIHIPTDNNFKYNVYLPKLKLILTITLDIEFDNYDCNNFKLYLFNDEEHFTRKIRIQIIL